MSVLHVSGAHTAHASDCVKRWRLTKAQCHTLQEIGILEQVMEEAVWALGDESYSILNQVQRPEHLVVHF